MSEKLHKYWKLVEQIDEVENVFSLLNSSGTHFNVMWNFNAKVRRDGLEEGSTGDFNSGARNDTRKNLIFYGRRKLKIMNTFLKEDQEGDGDGYHPTEALRMKWTTSWQSNPKLLLVSQTSTVSICVATTGYCLVLCLLIRSCSGLNSPEEPNFIVKDRRISATTER